MIRKRKPPGPSPELEELRGRLREAEDTLRALRAGEVDAVVVTRDGDEQVVTIEGADLPYRMLLEQMYAGAVTLTSDGVVVYCNHRFAEIVHAPVAGVVGAALSRLVPREERAGVSALLRRGNEEPVQGEFTFGTGNGTPVPVAVTFAPLRLMPGEAASGVIGVVTDVTEQRRQEELRTRLIEQVMTAQDEERGRIARELHDETGQSLTALLVGLRTVEGSRTIGEAHELTTQLREMTARTLSEVGRLARGLHPSLLDSLGLSVAVTRHVQDFARLHGITEDTWIEGLDSGPLSPLVEHTVYRVLQEALTNTARHAGASRVAVRLVRNETTVELRVRDDGVGFDCGAVPDGGAPAGRSGLGLHGMRERAALLGGTVEVHSAPGRGTTITARVPVCRR